MPRSRASPRPARRARPCGRASAAARRLLTTALTWRRRAPGGSAASTPPPGASRAGSRRPLRTAAAVAAVSASPGAGPRRCRAAARCRRPSASRSPDAQSVPVLALGSEADPSPLRLEAKERHWRRVSGSIRPRPTRGRGDHPAATAAALPPLEPPGSFGVPGVPGHPERRALGGADDRQLGHVRLADDHRPGRPQALDDLAVARGRTAERGGAVRRDLAGHVLVVLDGDGHAQQRALLAGTAPRVRLLRVRQRALDHHDPEGIQLRVEPADPLEVHLHQLVRRDLAGPDHLRLLDHAREGELRVVHQSPLHGCHGHRGDPLAAADEAHALARRELDVDLERHQADAPRASARAHLVAVGRRAAAPRRSPWRPRGGRSSRARRGSRATSRRRAMLSASRQRSSVSGKCWPMSPSPAAPSSASIIAWASTSASEWPARPRLGLGYLDAAEHEPAALLQPVRVPADAGALAHPSGSRRRLAPLEHRDLLDADLSQPAPRRARIRSRAGRARGRRSTAPPGGPPRGTSRGSARRRIDLPDRLAQPGGGDLDRDVGVRDPLHRALVEAAQVAVRASAPSPQTLTRSGWARMSNRPRARRLAERLEVARPDLAPGRPTRQMSHSAHPSRCPRASSRRKWTEPTT